MVTGAVLSTSSTSKVTNLIKNDVGLFNAAKAMGKDKNLQKEANGLVQKYLGGNKNPGKGTKSLTSSISYLRGNSGSRVFFRMKGNQMQVLAKSNKANEQKVIDILKKNYGE